MHNRVTVTLRHNTDKQKFMTYVINVDNNAVGRAWLDALKQTLANGNQLNKNYCFVGFPNTPRDLEYLCDQLNQAVFVINTHPWHKAGLDPYVIEDWYSPDSVRFGAEYMAPPEMYPEMLYHSTKHTVMNRLHNHFERLQGTVESPSAYFQLAPDHVRRAMGQLNTVCHEIENLVLSQRKALLLPEWIRPSQITTWHNILRYDITDDHRRACFENGYDRKFGHVYMHWSQIGKTLFEVFKDEDAPVLDTTICETITHLKYYSGEFDIEWGKDVVAGTFKWHDEQMAKFDKWLTDNGYDSKDQTFMLGYVPLGHVDLKSAFGSSDPQTVWPILEQYLDIYKIQCEGVEQIYSYTWRDINE